MAFSGFLSTQILWDNFHLNAKQVDQNKQKYSVYETNFQALKITTTSSRMLHLKALKAPIVILNFWASWCHPCLQEFPSLVEFQEKYKKNVLVVGINGDEDDAASNIKKIEKKYGLNFESVIDQDSAISNKFLINTYPVSIVFFKGEVIYVSQKIHDFMDPEFRSLIDKALKEVP